MDQFQENRIADEFCIQSTAKNFVIENDISEEYTLPDYMPDIKRILFFKCNTCNENDFLNDMGADISGDVIFKCFYFSEENQLRCIEYSTSYEGSQSLDCVMADSILFCKTTLKNTSVRAVNRRKIALKCKVTSDCRLVNKTCISPKVMGTTSLNDELALERNVDMIERVNLTKREIEDIRVSADIVSPVKLKEILCCDITLSNESATIDGQYINYKCKADVTLLCIADGDGEERYTVIEKVIPIEQSEECELPSDSEIIIKTSVCKTELNLTDDGNGESNLIELDFVCNAIITAFKNEKAQLTKDMFSTEFKYENEYETLDTNKLLKVEKRNFTLDAKRTLAENNYYKVLFSSIEAYVNKTEINKNKGVVDGECKIKLLFETEGDDRLASADYSLPFSFEFDVKGDDIIAYSDCEILSSNFSINGNQLNIDVEIGFDIIELNKTSQNAVKDITIDKNQSNKDSDNGVITFCYPDKNESLWDIAKHYSVNVSSLKEANNTDKIQSKRVLIVPNKKNT